MIIEVKSWNPILSPDSTFPKLSCYIELDDKIKKILEKSNYTPLVNIKDTNIYDGDYIKTKFVDWQIGMPNVVFDLEWKTYPKKGFIELPDIPEEPPKIEYEPPKPILTYDSAPIEWYDDKPSSNGLSRNEIFFILFIVIILILCLYVYRKDI
jgi:hypothetical protein